jgi:hypothetical protein
MANILDDLWHAQGWSLGLLAFFFLFFYLLPSTPLFFLPPKERGRAPKGSKSDVKIKVFSEDGGCSSWFDLTMQAER